ncbi:efflux RND transporter permease subunit [Peribacillus simplex]|uniref:efflux RND transporter permease subunit n=1 Tax=Peribacillus simplex TaxID=1478 RepID=UPI00366C907E
MIGNKLAVWILTVLLIVWGIFASTTIKYESIPSISLPTLSVSAVYPNATPEQIADDVSKPLEDAISSIKGVDSVNSKSSQNVASLTVNYDYDTDLDKAQTELEKAFKSVDLPEGVDEPTIMQFSSSMMPILALSVSSEDGNLKTATQFVEDDVKTALEKIDGVGQLTVTGQEAYEIELTYDEDKLAALGTTAAGVTQAIQGQNVTNQLGLYTLDDTKKSIVVNDKATSLKQLKDMDIVLGSSAGAAQSQAQPAMGADAGQAASAGVQTVKLKDVATLKKVENHDSISRVNGKDAISIQLTATQDANTVDVVNAVKDKITDLEKANSDMNIDITSDQGQPIEDSVNTMLEKAIYGAIFAVLVILIFLRNFRSTIISIVSIPLSLLTSIAIIKSLDMTLNMMTLGALTVAIGRVIDDSIVVVENIYRRMYDKNEPLRGRQLIASATTEMFKPILSSTLVTVAVFTPIIFIDGMVAELFGPFAITMAIALGISLIVAITVVPIMAHTMFKKEILATPEQKVGSKEKHSRMAIRYGKMLNAALNHKIITLVIALVILIGSVALLPKVGFSFFGSDQQTTMITTYTPATGELDDEVNKSVKEAEKYIAKQDDVTLVQSSITSSSASPDAMSMMAGSGSMLYIIFDEDTKNLDAKQQKLFDHLKSFGHKGTWKQQDMSMTGSSNEVSYTISSTDRAKVEKSALQIEDVLNDDKGLKDAKSSVSDSYPQYTFNLKEKALKQYGLTANQLSPMLMQATGDTIVTTLEDGDNTLNVIVAQDDSKTFETMKAFLKQDITTQQGAVKLSDLVSIDKSTTPSSISRQDNKEYATVTAGIKGDDVSAISARIKKEVNDIDFTKGVTLEQGGTSADIQESFTQLGLAIIAAIFLVYFILVVTFREGLAPFAILFSLPFTLIGAVLGLLIAGESFSVSSMLGILMLVGIVVTNAIVFVDRVIHNERAGETMRDSLIDAAETRLRPILMTAIATVFALLPLALSSSSGGSIISQGLGITVVGGLITSTILTLFIVPVVYEGLSKLFKKDRHKTIE